MGNKDNTDPLAMRILFAFAVPIIVAAIAYGVQSSRSESRDETLSRQIGDVRDLSRSELKAAIDVRSVQVDGIERRVGALEKNDVEKAATIARIDTNLALIAQTVAMQSKILEKIDAKIDARAASGANGGKAQ